MFLEINVTRKPSIENIDRNALVYIIHALKHHTSLSTCNLLSFIHLEIFAPRQPVSHAIVRSTLSCLSTMTVATSSWPDIKNLIDKVHRNACVHAAFSD